MRKLCLVLLMVLVAGCARHERRGDQAAVGGNWRKAVSYYKKALHDDPEDAEIKKKYQEACRQAHDQALRRARRHKRHGELGQALAEVQYAQKVSENSEEARELLDNIKTPLSLRHLDQAVEAAKANEFTDSFRLIGKVSGQRSHKEIGPRLVAAEKEIAVLAVERAKKLREEVKKRFKGPRRPGKFGRARYIDIRDAKNFVTWARNVDESHSALLRELEQEYEKVAAEEYKRLLEVVDEAMGKKEWKTAARSLELAYRIKPDDSLKEQERYCTLVDGGQKHEARADYARAEAAYSAAIDTRHDKSGFAAQRLALVKVQPYRFHVRSVLVRPTRPDGRCWNRDAKVGPKLARIVVDIGKHHLGIIGADKVLGGSKIAHKLIDRIEKLPSSQRPTLRLVLTLPDGRILETRDEAGVRVVFDSSFVLETNKLDGRALLFKVLFVPLSGGDPEVIGVADVTVKGVFEGAKLSKDQALLGMEILATVDPTAIDGQTSGFSVVSGRGNRAKESSEASLGTTGYKLTRVHARIAPGNYDATSAPDIIVEIEQGGRIVYMSPEAGDKYEASWRPEAVCLFVQPEEKLIFRIVDADMTKREGVFDWSVVASQLKGGELRLRARNGSTLDIDFEPRKVGP